MKSFSNIESDVEEVLDHYFWQCALTMNTEQLASSLAFLANRGQCPRSGKQITSHRDAQRINALMSTSGMYDQSGQFAFTVGLPAKVAWVAELSPLFQTTVSLVLGAHR